MRGTVIPLALFVLVLPGCGAASQSAPGTEPATVFAAVDPSEVTTKIVGGTPVQQKVLREVLAGIGADVFAEVEIERPAPGWGPSAAGSVALVVPRNVDDLRQEWLSWLLAQGFAQQSQELGLPSVSYLAPRRGGVDAESLHSTPQVSEQVTLSDARRAAEKARKAAMLNGGEVDRLEILRPGGYAFLVEMRVKDDPAKFLWQGLPKVLGAIGGPEPSEGQYAGDYTLVVDGDGNRLWEGAEAKLGEGSTQSGGIGRAELAGCSPFFIGGPPPGPPPCPVKSTAEPKKPSSTTDVNTRIVGATPKQETILREILDGLGQTVLEQVRVSPADADWTPSKPDSVVVHIDFTKADRNGRGFWETQLLAEAFERRSRALHLQPVAAYETATEGSALGGPDQERPARKPITEQELRSKSTAAAKESGAKLVELRILQPQHLTLAITLQVDNPADYLKHHLMTVLDAIPSLSDRAYDGLYLLVVDQKGEYVWFSAQTVSDTISGGGGSVRPDLAGCDPVPRLGSTMASPPPPCPVD